jgi:hypothetical protein
MIFEPEVKNEVIEFLLFSLKGTTVMIFTIIVSESNENWCRGEMLSEKLLSNLMGMFEKLVLLLVVLAIVFLGDFMTNNITI